MTTCKNRFAIKIFLTALVCLLAADSAYSREDLWQSLNAEISRLSQQGKYNDAVYVAKNAVKVAEKKYELLTRARRIRSISE